VKRSPMKRGKGIKPRNAKRRVKEWDRAYGSKARVRFVAQLPCAACGGGPCENAHTESGGAGRKADYTTIIPLCGGLHGCHAKQHRSGWLSIAMTETSRERAAALTEQLWQEARGGEDATDEGSGL